MPRLTTNQMNALNAFIQHNPTTTIGVKTLPHHNFDEVACWKWALFGLLNQVTYNGSNTSTVIHRPGEAFDAIVSGFALDPNSYWNSQLPFIQQEHQQVVAFDPDDNNHSAADWVTWRTWRAQVMQAMCDQMCTDLGFIVSGQPLDYALVMHYEDAPANGNPYGPNETHWWIEVPLDNHNFVCIETFPQKANPPTLQFRFNSRYSNNNNIRVPINNLLQAHINAIG